MPITSQPANQGGLKKHYTPVWYILTLSFLGGCPRSCYHHVNEPHFSVIFSSCQSGVIVI